MGNERKAMCLRTITTTHASVFALKHNRYLSPSSQRHSRNKQQVVSAVACQIVDDPQFRADEAAAQSRETEQQHHHHSQRGSQSPQRSPLNHTNSNSNLTDCHFKLKQQVDSNQNWGLYKLSFSSPSSDRQMASPPRPRGSDVSALKESTPKASTSNEPDKAVLQASPSKSIDRSTPSKKPDNADCGIYVGDEGPEIPTKDPPPPASKHPTAKHHHQHHRKDDDSDEEMEGTEAPVPETNNSREMKIFKKVLRDSKLREPFYHFLDQQFCAENLNFYVAVEQFRDYYCEDDITSDERAQAASWIYERHFAQNCSEPVNVDNSTAKRIKAAMKSGAYPKNTFDLAQYQFSFSKLSIPAINSAAPNADEESSVAFFTRAQLQEAREADKREKEARERSEESTATTEPAQAAGAERKDKKVRTHLPLFIDLFNRVAIDYVLHRH
ncbi:hypothetical protein WR25_04907 [Diploscapter pachys]|uniref:RGS domain-containing protein n=1 Tax=Diploscapter pachys TaxID=2018661 RepID=A0A2A2JIE7_9BILA|nr:hypothetical protein WR25_04907 [Diploscapter pachys]